jgi:hypothetical protein
MVRLENNHAVSASAAVFHWRSLTVHPEQKGIDFGISSADGPGGGGSWSASLRDAATPPGSHPAVVLLSLDA